MLATQNPIEQEGTYPLPEAQLDRFMFNVVIDYPTAEDERRILADDDRHRRSDDRRVATGDEIERRTRLVRDLPGGRERRRLRAAAGARDAAGRRRTARRSRPRVGALGRRTARRTGAAARRQGAALLDGRTVPSLDDVRAVALPVLRHRVLVNFQAEADGIDADQIVAGCSTRSRRSRRTGSSGAAETVTPPACSTPSSRRSTISSSSRASTVDGTLPGLHRSPFHGYSAEFSQYRHYRPGDDLKYIDWKLLARTDRLYTKQFRETTNMSAQIVLDASASMGFPGAPASTKFEYARLLAAALAHLIAGQGDAVGLVIYDSHAPVRAEPRRADAPARLAAALRRTEAAGRTCGGRWLRRESIC